MPSQICGTYLNADETLQTCSFLMHFTEFTVNSVVMDIQSLQFAYFSVILS